MLFAEADPNAPSIWVGIGIYVVVQLASTYVGVWTTIRKERRTDEVNDKAEKRKDRADNLEADLVLIEAYKKSLDEAYTRSAVEYANYNRDREEWKKQVVELQEENVICREESAALKTDQKHLRDEVAALELRVEEMKAEIAHLRSGKS